MNNVTIINTYKAMNGMNLSEPLYTFAEWKKAGYSVKNGEKSHHKFPIWKCSIKEVKNEETGETDKDVKIFMKNASFFTIDQVELIKVEKENDEND